MVPMARLVSTSEEPSSRCTISDDLLPALAEENHRVLLFRGVLADKAGELELVFEDVSRNSCPARADPLRKGVVFVGVDYLDQDPAAKRYLEKFNITFPNGADLASKISKRYAIRGVPETFFIDPEGKIVACRKIGPLSASELRQRISEIMPK